MTDLPAAQPVTNVYVQAPTQVLPLLSVSTAYLWWFFFGALGAHQFYLGHKGKAVSYIFTLGWLFVGIIIDLFTLPAQVRAENARRAAGGV